MFEKLRMKEIEDEIRWEVRCLYKYIKAMFRKPKKMECGWNLSVVWVMKQATENERVKHYHVLLNIVLESVWGPTRVRHGYRNTRGDRVTGSAGTGTVLDFDTPRHTVTRTRGTAGTHGYFIMGWEHFYWFFLTVFLTISWLCHTVTQPNMAVRGRTILPHPHHPSSPYK